MHYCFLGHQPELSTLEITVLTGVAPLQVTPEIIACGDEAKVLEIAEKLGGTSKIAEGLETVSQAEVIAKLEELIMASAVKNFAISNFTSSPISTDVISDLKGRIAAQKPVRFVSFADRGHELLMISKQHVTEFNLIPQDGKVVIASTVWIYDSLGFAARDRKKPYQDIKRGMLPVKIARLMVNLAVRGEKGKTVLDPFCGTGTVLSEAIMVGCKVIGSDIDHLAVSGAETNLSWLASRYNIRSEIYNLFVADATHSDEHVKSADAVVTEPLMGPLLDARNVLPEEKIKNIAKGLDKLYRGALKSWLAILPVGGRVVMTIPTFQLKDRAIPSITIDTIQALGYNYVLSVPYSKPGVTVIRNITILEKA